MDYEVFILTRMREEYDRTGSTAYAVEHGLGRTGRLVTSAALILFFAFAALASSPGTDIKVLATALGIGILLDATVVRALLVPALVSLFGKYNWWLPAGAAKILRVEPSPMKPDQAVPPGRRLRQRARDRVAGSTPRWLGLDEASPDQPRSAADADPHTVRGPWPKTVGRGRDG